MGYYTRYTIKTYKTDKNVKLIDILNKMTEMIKENKSKFYPFEYSVEDEMQQPWSKTDSYMEFETDDDCKWYEWEKDMKELSEAFPNIIFQVNGIGEENGDQWKAWVKNGKCVIHEARIVIDPLDEKELE